MSQWTMSHTTQLIQFNLEARKGLAFTGFDPCKHLARIGEASYSILLSSPEFVTGLQ
jgi:hypothetical protein